ncbi:hypothetical protein Dsin_027232 [Dipteronia sinensis]|uniref:Uncharacterized protein n=1 Tax=Dipteronia sinensis TaxID=43782 RepID=A0AAD9ZQ03_9ROSI|nr:hypothetical protein Dsin_027232 [Dipteronia sinensis]
MVKNGFSTPFLTFATLAAYGHEPIANLMQMGSENVRPETVMGLYTVYLRVQYLGSTYLWNLGEPILTEIVTLQVNMIR